MQFKAKLALTALLVSISFAGSLIYTAATYVPRNIQPEFMPYVADFERNFWPLKYKGTIVFADLPGSIAGLCTHNWQGSYLVTTIQIDFASWARGSQDFRDALMYHELSHCALGMTHDESGLTLFAPDKPFNGCPRTHMSPVLTPDICWHLLKPYYIEQALILLETR